MGRFDGTRRSSNRTPVGTRSAFSADRSDVALAGLLLKPPRKDAASLPEKGRDVDSSERTTRWCYFGMLGIDAWEPSTGPDASEPVEG